MGEKMWCDRLLMSLVFTFAGSCCALAAAPALDVLQQKSPAEAATVRDFIATCDNNTSLCEYKMRQALINNINTPDSVSICLKDPYPRTKVIAWLRAHSETQAMPTEDGLYTAYKSLYPCGRR
jgi:hypothetical protein